MPRPGCPGRDHSSQRGRSSKYRAMASPSIVCGCGGRRVSGGRKVDAQHRALFPPRGSWYNVCKQCGTGWKTQSQWNPRSLSASLGDAPRWNGGRVPGGQIGIESIPVVSNILQANGAHPDSPYTDLAIRASGGPKGAPEKSPGRREQPIAVSPGGASENSPGRQPGVSWTCHDGSPGGAAESIIHRHTEVSHLRSHPSSEDDALDHFPAPLPDRKDGHRPCKTH